MSCCQFLAQECQEVWHNCSMRGKCYSEDNLSFTYQTRISGKENALLAYAELFGVLQRRLFADVCSGYPTAFLKSDYIRRYGISARMFNAVRVTLDGRMSASTESQKLHRQTLEGLIARAEKQLGALVGRRATPQKLHPEAKARRKSEASSVEC